MVRMELLHPVSRFKRKRDLQHLDRCSKKETVKKRLRLNFATRLIDPIRMQPLPMSRLKGMSKNQAPLMLDGDEGHAMLDFVHSGQADIYKNC